MARRIKPSISEAAQRRALQGWKAIAGYLGVPVATARRWAKSGMPVRREGRFTVAQVEELSLWLGQESHMPAPAQVMTGNAGLEAALKKSIATTRDTHKRRAA